AANETLPCGAKLISASRLGRYVNALFRLTDRPGPGGGGCGSGAGQTARTDFLIADGRILEWIRAPDQPGGQRRIRLREIKRPGACALHAHHHGAAGLEARDGPRASTLPGQMTSRSRDPYDALGVRANASDAELRAAYRR